MRPRAILVLVALAIAAAAAIVSSGGSRGAELYHTSNPACVACHNERRSNLAHSTMDRPGVAEIIRSGKRGEMPGYKLDPADLEALVEYVVSLRRAK